MLLLSDTQKDEFAVRNPLLRQFVPDRHVYSTARSPGSELDEQNLLSAKIGKGNGLAIIDVGKREIGMAITHAGLISSGRGSQQANHHKKENDA